MVTDKIAGIRWVDVAGWPENVEKMNFSYNNSCDYGILTKHGTVGERVF
jgi:hypothetical protein